MRDVLSTTLTRKGVSVLVVCMSISACIVRIVIERRDSRGRVCRAKQVNFQFLYKQCILSLSFVFFELGGPMLENSALPVCVSGW